MTAHDKPMTKREAFELLGGSNVTCAAAVGVSRQAVNQWPDILPPRLADRVIAARWRLEQADKLEAKRAWARAQETRTPSKA